jgi:hypothetical protein
MSPIERAARAIAPHVTPLPWGRIPADKADLRPRFRNDSGVDINTPTKEDLHDIARAVLQAIREPSKAMVQAMGLKVAAVGHDDGTWSDVYEAWQSAIDAALEEA